MTVSVTTIKRLFAESGNQCAFRGCTSELIHGATGIVVGEICHICARSPGGPRYDESLPPEERDAYDNLILMCPSHHKVVDAVPEDFTVEALRNLKAEHREPVSNGPALSDADASRIADSVAATASRGSVITIGHMSGGQVAHQIVNAGPPKRSISLSQRQAMLAVLKPHAGTRIGFASTQGDVEAHEHKKQLMEVFAQAGWDVIDCSTFMFFGSNQGLVITIPFDAPEEGALQVVGRALQQTGQPVAADRGDMANTVGFYVQVWHAVS